MELVKCVGRATDYVRDGFGQGLEKVGDGIKWLGGKCRVKRMSRMQKAMIVTALIATAIALITIQAVAIVGALMAMKAGTLDGVAAIVLASATVMASNIALASFSQRAMKA